MEGDNADFVVIGAGIAGASAAFELAAHGEVVTLERESRPGYHTTGRSAAQLLESYGSLSTRRLTRGGRAFLESPPEGFTDVPLLAARSALFFAREGRAHPGSLPLTTKALGNASKTVPGHCQDAGRRSGVRVLIVP